ncbi:hypothetical protein [Sporomusa termitida]|uniref:Uncharacterized protein n=1 Tax=Sporomusa termitida TaxID=2377 RepID=A0A517DQL9_9FIRM|nr:hypothetical protein [Sporomusa termitida]QDR79617.1 hypothetical protein SPTER_08950 [Sporomusa termitida]
MIKAEFGIIDKVDFHKDYSEYEPQRYHCIYIDDDVYINDWWERLSTMKTYFHCMDRPEFALARWGVTLIPPESLPIFLDIVISDPRIETDRHLYELANRIREAIDANKFMIHYGL